MNFTREQMVVLADAFGLLARSAKKVRGVLLEAAGNQSVNSSPPPQEVSDPETELMEVDQDDTSSQKDDSIMDEDFIQTALEYLYSKDMIWSKLSASAFFKHMVRSRMRCNNLKFCWIHTKGPVEDRKNWKKVSVKTAENLFTRIRNGWDELLDEIRTHDQKPQKIRASKWKRRSAVLNCTFPKKLFQKKGFKNILVDLHDDLPSLK